MKRNTLRYGLQQEYGTHRYKQETALERFWNDDMYRIKVVLSIAGIILAGLRKFRDVLA